MSNVHLETVSIQLNALSLEAENIGIQLENVCERLDKQHATIVTALLSIMRKTGVSLPSEIREAHRPEGDELYPRVREAVIKARKASTSYLQRKFGIGYSRAAWLIDLLEERGVVGPDNGGKPRLVLEPRPRQRS